MRVGVIRERLLQQMSDVLQAGEINRVFLAADQFRVVGGALAGLADSEEIDLDRQTLDTAQAARMLGYHAEHVRRLIRQGAIQATKTGADYRIPLNEIFVVLARRHQDEAPPLLPNPRPEPVADFNADEGDLEIAIDVLVKRGPERQPVRLQRFNLELGDLLREPDERPGENGLLSGA